MRDKDVHTAIELSSGVRGVRGDGPSGAVGLDHDLVRTNTSGGEVGGDISRASLSQPVVIRGIPSIIAMAHHIYHVGVRACLYRVSYRFEVGDRPCSKACHIHIKKHLIHSAKSVAR